MRRSSRGPGRAPWALPAVLLLLGAVVPAPAGQEPAQAPKAAGQGPAQGSAAAVQEPAQGSAAAVQGQAQAQSPVPVAQQPEELEELARRALELLNRARDEAGLPALERDPTLEILARHHSREQATLGRVSHHSYEFGLSSERRLRIAFPTLPRLAENVARNRSIGRLHGALMASAGHRRNRLDPEFTHVGIGVARRGDYAIYLTEVFATAPRDRGSLGKPVAFYFDAAPDAYEPRPDPRVSASPETYTIGPPGPEHAEHWTNVGIEGFQSGDLEAAEAGFRKALELQPDYDYARYNLAKTLNGAGRPAEAVALLDELLAANPGDLDARATRGSAALLLQDYRAAEADFQLVLQGRRRDASAWYNLGLALEYQERTADAETAYRQAIHLDPELHAARAGLQRLRKRWRPTAEPATSDRRSSPRGGGG
ncbi:MAG TPA: tetratricopeptide repeat protein [Acidobacteriota bacterium]